MATLFCHSVYVLFVLFTVLSLFTVLFILSEKYIHLLLGGH